MLDAVSKTKAETVVLAAADRSSAFPPLNQTLRILRRRAERSSVGQMQRSAVTLLGVRGKKPRNTHRFSVTKVLRCFNVRFEFLQTIQIMVGVFNIGLGPGRTSTSPGDLTSLGAAYWLGAVVKCQYCVCTTSATTLETERPDGMHSKFVGFISCIRLEISQLNIWKREEKAKVQPSVCLIQRGQLGFFIASLTSLLHLEVSYLGRNCQAAMCRTVTKLLPKPVEKRSQWLIKEHNAPFSLSVDEVARHIE